MRNHMIQCNEANKTLGLIRRSYEHLDANTLRTLFIAPVRPHLEKRVVAWSPRLEKDRKMIEGVLRRAAKMVPSLRKLEYEERLEKLDLICTV